MHHWKYRHDQYSDGLKIHFFTVGMNKKNTAMTKVLLWKGARSIFLSLISELYNFHRHSPVTETVQKICPSPVTVTVQKNLPF